MSTIKQSARKLGKSFWAAITSTEAVKTEKSLAALIFFRVLISVGASASLVSLVRSILHGLGWA